MGARTASAVGKVMAALARDKQVLCISHLAPLAGLGKRHYRVYKKETGQRITAAVQLLPEKARIEELARMLGGGAPTEISISHARELYVNIHRS